MQRALIALVAGLLASGMPAPSAAPAADSAAGDALVLLDSSPSWKPWTQSVESRGGRVTVGFPPDGFLVQGPAALIADLDAPGVRVYTREVPEADLPALSATARLAAAVWNRRLLAPAGIPPLIPPRLSEPDALDPPASQGKASEGAAIAGAPTGAGFYDTSEFLEGSVAVGLILPESDGTIDMNRETWTTDEIQEVVTGVQGALAFLADQEPSAHLSFYLVVHDSMLTSYEPIRRGSHTSGEQSLWITECMDSLGFTTGDIFYRTRAFNNALRDSLGTDWGITMFVVDSSKDADGRFLDQAYAYSYIGGPFLVMTYDNWTWGIQNMDAIGAHETLHQFYALDEYLASPCTEACGYLGTQNQNSNTVGGCDLDVLCLMRDSVATAFDADSVCWFTRGQVGWRDTDGDSILDILDTKPETALDAFPDTTVSRTPTLTGTANVTMFPNTNPRGQGNEITTVTISLVQYRVDGGAWLPAAPVDGTWDEGVEAFTLTTDTLSEESHLIETRAVSSVGNPDTTPAGEAFTILDVTPPAPLALLAATATETTVRLSWTLPITADCAGVRIRYRTDAYPSNPTDGALLGDFSGLPGAADSTLHSGAMADTPYYYAAFTQDEVPNYSVATHALATPLDPAPPSALEAPVPGSSYVSLIPVFRWTRSIPEEGDSIAAYWMTLADNPGFANPVVDEEVVTGPPADTTWALPDSLARGTTYFVRLRAKDVSSGTYGYFSQTFSFTTRIPVDAVAWRSEAVSAWTNFSSGDTLPAGADARLEVAFRPADSLGLGGHAGRVVYTRNAGASWDSVALAWHHADGDTGFFRATLGLGAQFQHHETVAFRVEGWDPPDAGAPHIDDGGYTFVAGANPVGSFHVPTQVGYDSETMRDPVIGNELDSLYAFQIAAPAGRLQGATLRLRAAADTTFSSHPAAYVGSLSGNDYFRVALDTVFATEDSVVYYIVTWGSSLLDTTYLGGTNDQSVAYLVEAGAAGAPFGFRIGTVTAVGPGAWGVGAGSLSQNVPNPFNPQTTIPFELSSGRTERVRLSIYDASGRLVRVLVDAALPPGRHTAAWDGVTDSGTPAGSGLYLYELRADSGRALRRMTLVR